MATEMMKAVLVEEGAPLKLGDFEKPDLKPGEVLVKVAASGLNRADLVQRRGAYPPPPGASPIMGLEISGTVVETSDGASRFKIGDRVAGLLAGGGYAEFAAVDEGSLFPVPDGMDMVKAACFPEALMTVWANVFDRVGFQTGEAFLCHGGTSGIGIMALQMAKIAGASKIYATAGSAEKCALATELGADRAINYKTEDVGAALDKHCPKGIDINFENVGGKIMDQVIARLNDFSRMPLCGLISTYNATDPLPGPYNFSNLLMRRTSLKGFIVIDYFPRFPEGIQQMAQWLMAGKIKFETDIVDGLENAPASLSRLFEGKNLGKLMVQVSEPPAA